MEFVVNFVEMNGVQQRIKTMNNEIVKLVSHTQVSETLMQDLKSECVSKEDKDFLQNLNNDLEALMIYIARVSSPNQKNIDYSRLLSYCAKHGHWSVFEQVEVAFEIETNVAVAAQILRHRSATFQQLSRRYSSDGVKFDGSIGLRRQDNKNRQNSIDDFNQEDKEEFRKDLETLERLSVSMYDKWLGKGGAKEVCRFMLPQSLSTRMYMKNNLRNWIHYVNVRSDPSTQLEHRVVAEAVKQELIKLFPVTAKAFNWV